MKVGTLISICVGLAYIVPSAFAGDTGQKLSTADAIEYKNEIYNKLNNVELKSVIIDKNIRYHDIGWSEFYSEAGYYVLSGTRAPMKGTFKVHNNELCVYYHNKEQTWICKKIYRHQQKYILTENHADNTVSIREISITE